MNCLHSPVCRVLRHQGDKPGWWSVLVCVYIYVCVREISVEGDRPNRQEQGSGTATGLTLSSGTCTNNCGKHVKHCCTHVRRACVWGRVLARADFSPCCVCMCVCFIHVLPLGCKCYALWSVIKSFCMRGSVSAKVVYFLLLFFFCVPAGKMSILMSMLFTPKMGGIFFCLHYPRTYNIQKYLIW